MIFFCPYSQELSFITYFPIVYRKPQTLLKKTFHLLHKVVLFLCMIQIILCAFHTLVCISKELNKVPRELSFDIVLLPLPTTHSEIINAWKLWSSLYTSLYTCYTVMCAQLCWVYRKHKRFVRLNPFFVCLFSLFHARAGREWNYPV